MPATTSRLTNAQDTHVSGKTANRTKNYRNSVNRAVGAGTDLRYSYFYFTRPFPLGATIVSAKLRLTAVTNPASQTYTLKKLTGAWSATKVTYNAAPAATATGQIAQAADLAAGGVLEIDVTAHMQSIAAGAAWYGWRLETNNTAGTTFAGSLATTGKPELVVVWNMPPQEPIGLSPAGSRAVGINKPVLSYDFRDANGESDIRAHQVQIYVTWPTITYDSGEVLTDEPAFDLTGTSFTAVQGTTYWWRVRCKDDSGVWSPWSAVAPFVYEPKGTLTMTVPAGTTITDPSPPVAWTFTGRTQGAWQVFVHDVAANAVVYNSGKASLGHITDWTIPAGYIKTDGAQYIIRVRVWDTISRESVRNSLAYQDAVRTVTFQVTGGIAAVTSMTATQVGETPRVRLAWTRSEMPDGFLIKRQSDGVTVTLGANVDPLDIDLTSTTYEFYDDSAPGNTTLTYSVHPIVNGQTGPATTVTLKTKVRGIWLSDPARGLRVQLLGDDEGSWEMEDASGIHQPIGASFAVKITSSLRGYSGNLSGYLMKLQGGPEVKTQEQVIWSMKSTPEAIYTLHVSDMCIPVVLGNVTSRPTPRPEYEREVSFDFYQTGWGSLPFRPNL